MARILVIDDEAMVRDMLRQTPEGAGHEVIEARDGQEGLQCYHAAPADLIITDILMPEKEGLETIMDLRRETPQVKIIAISGAQGMEFTLDMARHLGAQRVFQKPFGVREMLEAVHEVLESE